MATAVCGQSESDLDFRVLKKVRTLKNQPVAMNNTTTLATNTFSYVNNSLSFSVVVFLVTSYGE